ncbi:probable E3 ubiquitin-protein ligase RHG1A isoform X2 [Juglans microcarpa x Juglans regia]|uniref:probable E3 ubiquitin-protein ligase RHG1A isoform X2 n=1 Tax=Juglans microcarpa x Juglans regia TaxID=2249226 RepID=UPI001B7E3FA3|nr:probable E3 ubiquitin-protein ligase RHG1A isoform X2 [Juglans microcarpa x Juglans regia]
MSNGWSLGEPSSSNSQNEVRCDEQKAEFGLSSSGSACPAAGLRLEEWNCEPSNNTNGNPLFAQNSNSNVHTQNPNLNTDPMGHGGDNSQAKGCPNIHKSIRSENWCIPPPASSSDHHVLPSRPSGVLVTENDGGPGCSMEGRRVPCKRKALEGNAGQSSVSGSSSYFHPSENSARSAVPARFNLSSSLGVSATPEQVNPRFGLGTMGVASDFVPDLSSAGSFHRNTRLRINPSNQQDSIAPTLISTANAVRHSSISSSLLSPRLLPVGYSLDLRSTPASDRMIPQSQPVLVHVPTLPRNVEGYRWNGGPSLGAGNITSSMVSRDRDSVPHEEMGSRSMTRNLSEHPVFMPAIELRNLVRNPANRGSTSGNVSIPGNVASTSRPVPSSGVHPSPAPTLAPQHSPQFQRRFSEYVRRSLMSSAGSESGGQRSNYSPLGSGPIPSQELGFSSGPGNPGHAQSHPRSALWVERQGDGGLGIPYLLRTSAAASEGSSRFVSELFQLSLLVGCLFKQKSRSEKSNGIRNVLGLMRRGESLRLEDVMILDQSVFLGVADIHDRYRDMRLDVDNMSYEELLALEERIGNVSTGLSEETILNRLRQRKCSIAVGSQLDAEPCCICQEVYIEGDDLGTLECGHNFHADCIKQWLMQKNLCPVCKTTALTK